MLSKLVCDRRSNAFHWSKNSASTCVFFSYSQVSLLLINLYGSHAGCDAKRYFLPKWILSASLQHVLIIWMTANDNFNSYVLPHLNSETMPARSHSSGNVRSSSDLEKIIAKYLATQETCCFRNGFGITSGTGDLSSSSENNKGKTPSSNTTTSLAQDAASLSSGRPRPSFRLNSDWKHLVKFGCFDCVVVNHLSIDLHLGVARFWRTNKGNAKVSFSRINHIVIEDFRKIFVSPYVWGVSVFTLSRLRIYCLLHSRASKLQFCMKNFSGSLRLLTLRLLSFPWKKAL